ncbi:DUF7619 domain-containing protein [Chryseobacterium gregarium]|uniref:DUF7619 domain-containing protein n=1 Tax=Chryseobacterium gregarium TaxID=456299 RepID=UPI00040EB267|nr:T9SS type A sorting domain-containing protein [Chryseobacterium gregarium]
MILFSVFQAQIVNIPDPIFKAKLISSTATNGIVINSSGASIKLDTNNDGEVQVSEALTVSKIDIYNSSVTDLTGINSFINLKALYIGNNNLSSISLNLPILEVLRFGNSGLNTVDIMSCPNLVVVDADYFNPIFSLNSNTVTYLTVGGNNLQTINLQGLTALKQVNASGPALEIINGSNMPTIEEAYISYSPLMSQINFSGSSNFKKLDVHNTGLTNLNLTNYTGLIFLNCSNNTFSNVVLDGCTSLSNISLANNNISAISMNGANAIGSVNLSNNQLTSISFSNLSGLGYLDLRSNNLSNITLNNLPNLWYLYLSSNQLTSLNLSTATKIKSLLCSYNKLSNIDVSMLTDLSNIECAANKLIQLDLSNNKLLQNITCNYNPHLEQLFIKNQTVQPSNVNFIFPNPSLKYICCDASEITDYTNHVSMYNPEGNTIVNSDCYFIANTNHYVQGNTKYDINNNGCDTTDPNKAFQKFSVVNSSASGTFISGISGSFSIPVPIGSTVITPFIENPGYFNFSPVNFTANITTSTINLAQNFCISANGNHNDLEVLVIPVTAAAPGFNTKYKIIYKNKGTAAQSGTLAFNYNDILTDYLTATVNPSSQLTGLLNWDFTNLLPFETREITVTLKLNTPTQVPPLNGSDVLHYTAQINGATDETPLDNTFTLNQTVVNSFDPNDKTCLEGTSIAQAKVGDYVHYLIRFENTGTANAQNIVVKDVIDTSKFDLSSLVAMNGSHNFVTRITNGNTVEFIFENIQLPFNNATNDGYVSFKIKTKSTLSLGDSFSNTAKIYFDYNAPILTNTYTTNVQNVLATSETNKENKDITIYPNPVKDILYIQSKTEIVKAEVYDAAGRIITSVNVKGNSVNVSELAKGSYIIRLSSKDKTVIQKFIKD